MVATVPAGATIMKTAKNGRVQYRIGNQFHWTDLPDADVPPTVHTLSGRDMLGHPEDLRVSHELARPGDALVLPVAAPPRYAELIAHYEALIDFSKRTAMDPSVPVDQRGAARGNIIQYQMAIKNAQLAALIPEGTEAWFASYPDELKTQLPPVLYPRYMEGSGAIITTQDNVIRTRDPLAIAWLRQVCANPDMRNSRQIVVERTHEAMKYPLVNHNTQKLFMWADLQAHGQYRHDNTRYAPADAM